MYWPRQEGDCLIRQVNVKALARHGHSAARTPRERNCRSQNRRQLISRCKVTLVRGRSERPSGDFATNHCFQNSLTPWNSQNALQLLPSHRFAPSRTCRSIMLFRKSRVQLLPPAMVDVTSLVFLLGVAHNRPEIWCPGPTGFNETKNSSPHLSMAEYEAR